MNSYLHLTLQYVISPVITFILGILWSHIKKRFVVSQLERFLWLHKNDVPLTIVHGGYEDQKNIKKETKIGDRFFTLVNPVDKIEVVSFCEFISNWGELHCKPIEFKSDIEIEKDLSCSFLSLGGPDFNIKSFQQVENNSFNLKWPAQGKNICVAGKSFDEYHTSSNYEYAVIMRQTILPFHSYILCAGLGAKGTLWAGQYLAKKWKEIHAVVNKLSWCPLIKTSDFLIILKFPRNNHLNGTICAAFINKKGNIKELFSK